MNAPDADARFMAEALEWAARGRYTAAPNPCVGCLVVADGVPVGRGFHRRAGEPHAESLAMAQAGVRAQGATLYVTLEPCAHQGRTPACASAVIAAGIARVVSAAEDPNPRVAGRGHAALRDAGIACSVGLGARRTRELNRGFWQRMTAGRPWVRVKQAMSLDGGTALADGRSQWITGGAARADVQRWRAQSSAVLSTAATVVRDDARLNVRLDADALEVDRVRQPHRVIVDRRGELTAGLALWEEPGPCLVCTRDEHAGKLRRALPSETEVAVIAPEGRGLDLAQLLARLAADWDVNDVLVEAGAKFAGALLRQDLVDEMIVYIAPRLLGAGAAPLAELPAAPELPEELDWTLQDACALGADARLRYYRER